jgi:hypothetical protein
MYRRRGSWPSVSGGQNDSFKGLPHTAQAWNNAPSGTRSAPLALRLPARYANRASSRYASVVAAAPARTVTVPPTGLHCCLTPVGGSFTCAHTRGKSAPLRGGTTRWDAAPIRSITGRPSLVPSSFTRCPVGSSYGFLSGGVRTGGQRAYHVPQAEHTGGLGRVSSPVVRHLRRGSSEPPDLTTCLLAQA